MQIFYRTGLATHERSLSGINYRGSVKKGARKRLSISVLLSAICLLAISNQLSAQSVITHYFRSIKSGMWSDPNTWESSPSSTYSYGVVSPATLSPTSASRIITVMAGDTVTLDDSRTLDQVSVVGTLQVAPGVALTLRNGSLVDLTTATTGKLVLLSTSEGYGWINTVPSGAKITGKVTVEQYFPARRAWQLITAPLDSANTIYDAWQNGKKNVAGRGTFITGPKAVSGLDDGRTYSLQLHNFFTQKLEPLNGTTISLSSNLPTVPTRGYFLFVRGDRNPANLTPPNTNATTLSATGNPFVGQVTFMASGNKNDFGLIGNPYAAPVDFSLIDKTNLANRYYVWDASMGDVGGYVMFDYDENTGSYSSTPETGLSPIIQSGQAFFVQLLADGVAKLVFQETNKTPVPVGIPGAGRIVKTTSLKADLLVKSNNKTTLADGVKVAFSDTYQSEVGSEDALKMENFTENIAISKNTKALTLEKRPTLRGNDTIFLKVWNTSVKSYQLKITPSGFEGVNAVLEDAYTGKSTALSATEPTTVDFSVTADAKSAKADRFRIVLSAAAALPITSTTVKAIEKNAGVQLNWFVATEKAAKSYIVEKSTDGINYSTLSEVNAKLNDGTLASYELFDASAVKGSNYYRVKSISVAGDMRLSQVVNVNIGGLKSYITAYPNPVVNKTMNVQLVNKASGNYSVQVFSKDGQTVLSTRIVHLGGSSSELIQLPASLSKGSYQLKVSDGKSSTVQQIIVNK